MATKQKAPKATEVSESVMDSAPVTTNGKAAANDPMMEQINTLRTQANEYMNQAENAKTMYLKTLGALELLQSFAANNRRSNGE